MKKKDILYYGIFLLLSFGFAFCFGRDIIPFNLKENSFDAACFSIIGKGILNGKMPYLDYVDNKGPVLYLLFALSSLIGPFPWDVFLLTVISVFASLIIINEICKDLSIKHRLIPICMFLLIYIYMFAAPVDSQRSFHYLLHSECSLYF